MGKKVYIDFTRPANCKLKLFSWAIRLIQGTKYSHVLLRYESKLLGQDVVYEASGKALKFMGPQAQSNRYEIIKSYEIEITDTQYRKMIKLCLENAGIDYGVKQIIGIFLVYLFKLKKNPFADGRKSQVCSEIVGRFLEEVKGWDTGLDLDIAGPKQIDEFLEENYYRRN